MIPSFKNRQANLVEWMDRSDCDPIRLSNTYKNFSLVNRLISRWQSVYRKFIRPDLRVGKPARLLDVGCGGGDIARMICGMAETDGFRLDVTGIDPDSRALVHAHGQPNTKGNLRPHFMRAETSELVSKGEVFDFVISNHVLHHLETEKIPTFLTELKQLASIRVICNDIERSALGYLLFSIATRPFFKNSFIQTDGLMSIRKSFTERELSDLVPEGWHVTRKHPFRILAIYSNHR